MNANVFWGIRRGLYFASGFSVFVLIEYLLLGSAPFSHAGVTLGEVIALYFAAGILAGGLVGILRPLNRTFAGATTIGILAAAVVYGLAMITIAGLPNRWHVEHWIGLMVLSVAVGGYLGGDSWS